MSDSNISTQEKIANTYAPIVEKFAKELKNDDLTGIQAPHLPIAGKNYDLAKYKFAFMGMETYGWDSLSHFMDEAERNPQNAVVQYNSWLNDEGILNHRGPATFFGFIIKFLAAFYKIDYKELINKEAHNPLLTSFVWGNTNSIERFEVTAEYNGGRKEVWDKVKKCSKDFDSINLLIKSASPKIVFILYKWVDENYILQNDDALSATHFSKQQQKFVIRTKPDIECNYEYFYLRDENTHVFVLPHPRWIGLYGGGHDKYIDSIIKVIESQKIWNEIPEDWKEWKEEYRTVEKYEYIANLASFLVEHNMVMSGQQLAMFLNLNGYRKQNGRKFNENGGVGIHHLISSVWNYYYNKKDYLTALKIAKAFVNKYGYYAYI